MVTTIKLNQLTKFNPLVWPGQVDIALTKNRNIFLGGGIATKSQISQATPFDLVGFLLTAEQLRRKLNSHVHLLIADQHAWLANHLSQQEATHAADRLSNCTRQIVNNLGFSNWHLHLASQIFPNTTPQSYEQLELRDVNHFANHFHCGLKLGWTFSPKESGKTDESHFDQLHHLPTILIKPGQTLDTLKPHESPYICTNPPHRLIIAPKENPADKLTGDLATVKRVANHLRFICLLWEHLVDPFPPKTPLLQKLEQINKTIVE